MELNDKALSSASDIVVIGGGHNGLVAATMLARSGKSVVILERLATLGGAAVSESPFAGVDARVSRYSYLVSLFPRWLLRDLNVAAPVRRRTVSSYTPSGTGGLLVDDDVAASAASMAAITGDPHAHARWCRFYADMTTLAGRLFPTLTEPLMSRADIARLVDDPIVWKTIFEKPISDGVEHTFDHDLVRGVVLTDALIGTFASAAEPSLTQNRCFLYHVIGNGTGSWDIPVGGMGAITQSLVSSARRAGVQIHTGAEVVHIDPTARGVDIICADGSGMSATHVLANIAPAVLARLLGEPADDPAPEGSQLKINMVLRRLPRLRDTHVDPLHAFSGTFHVNEGYEQLQTAYIQAQGGTIPQLPPCETYCHSVTDPSILGEDLRQAGAQTLTVFGLHMPARLFRADNAAAKRDAVAATLRSLNSVLAEPIEDCLWSDANGAPCLEARTPIELQSELALPSGHIFHRDLTWPYAEMDDDVGKWGVETAYSNVWICGAGARRGGGVSGIPGHNAARAVMASESF